MKPSTMGVVLESFFKNREPLLIKGAPGVGKSDIVADAAERVGMELMISHPVVSDPVDYKGLPFATTNNKGETVADFLPIGELRLLLKAKKPLIYFLDDLGQAPPVVQAACMQLLLARAINGHKISKHVTFVAATNRKSDKAGVSGILEPVKSRFTTILELVPDVDDWIDWAIKNNMPGVLRAFISFRRNFLTQWEATSDMTNSACPRTIANAGRICNMMMDTDDDAGKTEATGSLYAALEGAAGQAFASEFWGFIRIYKHLPDPKLALKNPMGTPIPTDPATCYGFCTAVADIVTKDTLENFITLVGRFQKPFMVMAMKTLSTRDKKMRESIPFINWLTDNNDILMG